MGTPADIYGSVHVLLIHFTKKTGSVKKHNIVLVLTELLSYKKIIKSNSLVIPQSYISQLNERGAFCLSCGTQMLDLLQLASIRETARLK